MQLCSIFFCVVCLFSDGFFVYAEGYNRSALLLAPQLSLSGSHTAQCLSFWYYSYGHVAAANTLHVYVGREQVYSRPEWSYRQPQVGVWTRGVIRVTPRVAPLQIVFAAQFMDVFGGIALDDISIINGICDFCRSSFCCLRVSLYILSR